MAFMRKRSKFQTFFLLMSITAGFGADKKKPRFEPAPASSYPQRQTSDKITVAASVVETDEQAQPAFGKLNPYRYGLLPILVVIQNDSANAIRVDNMKLQYVMPDRSRVENTPAQDVRFLRAPKQPKMTPGPVGGIHIGKNKNPLAAWEIEGRAFSAKMVPPGQSASGFF